MKVTHLILITLTCMSLVNCKSSQKFDESQLQKGISLDATNSANNIHIMKDTVIVYRDTLK